MNVSFRIYNFSYFIFFILIIHLHFSSLKCNSPTSFPLVVTILMSGGSHIFDDGAHKFLVAVLTEFTNETVGVYVHTGPWNAGVDTTSCGARIINESATVITLHMWGGTGDKTHS